MHKCVKCGAKLRRIHRTLSERIVYMAIFKCQGCQAEQVVPRSWLYHFGPDVRCPQCGTYRVTKLRSPDKIDPMAGGLLNRLERVMNGRLFHCRFCRIQFYDRREMEAREPESRVPHTPAVEPAPAVESEPETSRRSA
jgi:DNA-directed RNA polymerase subunit RPC12/RpoP